MIADPVRPPTVKDRANLQITEKTLFQIRFVASDRADGWRISCMLVGIDCPRCRMARSTQADFARKRLAAASSCLAERRKSRVAPVVDSVGDRSPA
jgi:hypothetical protein